jgi:small ligand-binding sensory domain FIST
MHVRLRHPLRSDASRLRALHHRIGLETDDVALRRMLRFDPRESVALVATLLVGRTEEMVGFALRDRDAEDADLLLADEALAPGIRAHLDAAMARSAAWPPKPLLVSSR